MVAFHAVLVAAVSTVAQAAEGHESIPAQLAACRLAAERLGAVVVAEVVIPGHSRDYAFLGDLRHDSPEYDQLCALLEQERANLVICWRYDRLWRSDWLRSDFMRLATLHGAQVYATEQPKAPADPATLDRRGGLGRIMEQLSGALSEEEQRTRVARHRVGMAGRIRRGLAHPGPNPPYGYGPGMVVNEAEAAWVRWAFERLLSGRGVSAIAADLTAMHVPTPARARPALTASDIWHPRTLRRILSNPIYIGHVRWGGLENPDGAHAHLIDNATWEAAQRLLAERGLLSYPRTYPASWLRGLVRCGYCGRAMAYYKALRASQHIYLRCSFYVETHGAACQNNGHPAERVHAFVLAAITAALRDPDAWAAARAAQRSDGHHAQELSQLSAAITSNRERHARILAAYEAGAVALGELVERRTRLDTEHAALVARQAALGAEARSAVAARDAIVSLGDMLDALPSAPPEVLARIARTLLASVVLRRGADPDLRWL